LEEAATEVLRVVPENMVVVVEEASVVDVLAVVALVAASEVRGSKIS
jgi:hypothetical protein